MQKRLAKVINEYGYCSRREAERLILSGRVKLNNIVVSDVVTFVTESDQIKIDDDIITKSSNENRLWIYYKPRGEVTSRKDEKNRLTIFKSIEDKYPSIPYLISVGRLDIDSEGLILLTNNGKISRYFEMPSNEFTRVYKAKVYGDFTNESISLISNKITINGITYNPLNVKLIKTNRKNSWFEVTLKEGKNREIRKLFEHIGMKVNRLIRVRFGNYKLDNLKVGELIEIKNPKIDI